MAGRKPGCFFGGLSLCFKGLERVRRWWEGMDGRKPGSLVSLGVFLGGVLVFYESEVVFLA